MSKLLQELIESGRLGKIEPLSRRPKMRRAGAEFTAAEKEYNFWARVDYKPDGCWNWKGCLVGKLRSARCGRYLGEQVSSRVCWKLTRGEIPADQCVLHKCDNESCIRPDHLFLGTRVDNNADKLSKGRQWRPAGTLNPNAKLTEEKVRDIRRLRGEGKLQREIAEEVGVSRSSASKVLSGAWEHVV